MSGRPIRRPTNDDHSHRSNDHEAELVDSQSTPTGVLMQTYRPAGRATFATVNAE
jgi:hypothetical protein